MTNLTVSVHKDILVVDSRLVAENLGIEHKNFLENIEKYKTQTESAFGVLRVETEKPKSGSKGGRPEKFVWLTEDQATFYMTLSRNTPEVVMCKLNLVKAFSEARRQLEEKNQPKPRQVLGAYTERVEAMMLGVSNKPRGYWSVFEESSNLLIYVETVLKLPVDRHDLLDGSIGLTWSNYRKGKPWCGDRLKFDYTFPDGRRCQPWCYQMKELEAFRMFLEDIYKPKLLPKYLAEKYPQPALTNS